MARLTGCVTLFLLYVSISNVAAVSLTPADRRLYDDLKSGRGLYNNDDKVTVLNANNFKSSVYGTGNAWIIEFYNSWCGFCHRFAPIWKNLAADIYGNTQFAHYVDKGFRLCNISLSSVSAFVFVRNFIAMYGNM